MDSFESNKAAAKASGKSSFHYSIYTPRVASVATAAIHVSANGKSVYAAGPQSGSLAQIDATSGEVKKNIPLKGGAQSIVALGEGATLLAIGSKGVGVIDAGEATVGEEWVLGGSSRPAPFAAPAT